MQPHQSSLSDHVKALVWCLNVSNEMFQVGVNKWLAFAKQTYKGLTPIASMRLELTGKFTACMLSKEVIKQFSANSPQPGDSVQILRMPVFHIHRH